MGHTFANALEHNWCFSREVTCNVNGGFWRFKHISFLMGGAPVNLIPPPPSSMMMSKYDALMDWPQIVGWIKVGFQMNAPDRPVVAQFSPQFPCARCNETKNNNNHYHFTGLCSASSAVSGSVLPSKLNKISMAPPQNMVIRPLHENWKEGSSFKGHIRRTIHCTHCHLSLKEVASKKHGRKADGLPHWAPWAPLCCLDTGNHSHGWEGYLTIVEEFNQSISSSFDSTDC